MNTALRQKALLALALCASATAVAGDLDTSKKAVVPPEEDHWKFLLTVPGWLPNVDGTVGINGRTGNVSVPMKDIIPKVDMAWSTSAELSKGRFGVMGELIYLSLSGSTYSDSVLRKIDVRADEYLADFTVRWRLWEGPRGYLDGLIGLRYTNLYQAVALHPNIPVINEVSHNLVDDVSAEVRKRIDEVLSQDRFRNALEQAVKSRLQAKLESLTGPNPPSRQIQNAPLAFSPVTRLGRDLDRLIFHAEADLVKATVNAEEAAIAAERQALQTRVAADRAALQQRAATLRALVNQKIATAQANLQRKIADKLEGALSQRTTRDDAWWDPYVGLRARYNFTPAIYAVARTDIGGFGIGSELMWQAEGALGFQISRTIGLEFGYRALSFDYENNGLTYNVITHGPQITLVVLF